MTGVDLRDLRISSMAALKTAHLELEKRYKGKKPRPPDLLDEIEAFVRRGQATGALLDSRDEQTAGQSLLDYWATVLSRFHRDIDATLAEYDPNEAPDLSGVECPYKGLDSFREQDSRYFFGRERLVQELRERLDK